MSEGITGRTPYQCFTKFRDHVADLVTEIVPTDAILQPKVRAGDKRYCTLEFSNAQDMNAAPIETRVLGRVFLHLAQDVQAAEVDKTTYRLRTLKYRYALYATSPMQLSEPWIRWEYETKDKRAHEGPARHHMQLGKGTTAQRMQVGACELDLNRIHAPTGWVLIEEVFRFLIHDLGMEPPCGAKWPDVLHASETAFHEDFTTRSMTPSVT
jgi:hypothetical protein